MTALLTSIGSVATAVIDNGGDVIAFVIAQPLLLYLQIKQRSPTVFLML